MKIDTVITSVNYGDFLALTLPRTLQLLKSVTVLASPNDALTIRVAQEYGANLIITDVWMKNNSLFNKSKALNNWLKDYIKNVENQWILTLDADIFLPLNTFRDMDILEVDCLYSIPRRMCIYERDWQKLLSGVLSVDKLPLTIPIIKNGKVWGSRPTSNPAAISGYFQLWNPMFSSGYQFFPESPTAKNYDVEFALSFPEKKRFFLSHTQVIHLGPAKTNWNGRVCENWDYNRYSKQQVIF